MNRNRLSVVLAALAVLTPLAVRAASIADVDAVPTLKPTLVLNTPELDRTLEKQLKLEIKNDAFNYWPLDDPEAVNQAYQQRHPFPEMYYVPLVPSQGPFGEAAFGVLTVNAYRRRWTRGERGLKEEKPEAWQWRAPREIQKSVQTWASHSLKDPYAALVLSPERWKDRDPLLLYFDARSGLRWQVGIPLEESLKKAPVSDLGDPYSGGPEAHDVCAAITADGSRVLVLVPRRDLHLSVLFVYAGDGALLRTLLFPKRIAGPTTSFSGGILRTPGGGRFLLSFYRERYLADGDGNLLCRFVDEQGKDVLVQRVSEDEKSAYGGFGSIIHYIYTLPNK